jgi:hypothetical protein
LKLLPTVVYSFRKRIMLRFGMAPWIKCTVIIIQVVRITSAGKSTDCLFVVCFDGEFAGRPGERAARVVNKRNGGTTSRFSPVRA